MELTQRDRISLVLAICLVPTMIYLFYTNINKAKMMRKSLRTVTAEQPLDVAKVLQAVNQPKAPVLSLVSPKIQEERLRIGQQVPLRNPFATPSAARPVTNSVVPEPVSAPVPGPAPVMPMPPKERDPVPAVPPTPVSRPTGPREHSAQLKVTGIVTQGPGKKMAVINGKLFGEGETVAGFKVIEVGSSAVIVGSGERRITIPVGKEYGEPSSE